MTATTERPTAPVPVSLPEPRRRRRPSPLVAVVAVQAVCTLLLRNSAFSDEALYIYAGHRLIAQWLDGTPTYDEYHTYFSGAPFFYPVLAAVVDDWLGLAGVRLLSLVLMLAATVWLHGATRVLFDHRAAHIGALLFAMSQPVLFMGHLATYDALTVALLALALRLAVAPGRLLGWWLLAVVPLGLAMVAKYAAAMYVVPVIGMAGLAAVARTSWWRGAVRVVLLSSAVVGLAVLGLSRVPELRSGIEVTTSARPNGVDAPVSVLLQAAQQIGPHLIAALLGLAVLAAGSGTMRGTTFRVPGILLGLGAVLTGLAAPLHQAQLHTTVSLGKHTGYGLLFMAPVAGVGLAYLLGRRSLPRLFTVAAVTLGMAATGFRLAETRYADWPRTDAVMALLRTQVRPVSGQYLVEEAEVPRYYLRDVTEPYQWHGTFQFSYHENGHHLEGVPAYQQAIRDRYFDVIVLRYGPTKALDRQIDDDLEAGRGYTLIATIEEPSSFGPATFLVWRRS
ncbi:MAG: glycosyltransferase family 39 protein [Actinomycetia bacterium]|nr:glycosyltransferase family 39 protein [Actinomycetes bacterium]